MERLIWAAFSGVISSRPDVWKNSFTALSSNEGAFAKSITTCATLKASASPSPVVMFTPECGDAAMTSWPLA